MEMRAIEDVPIGQDLTPPLPPLAFALHDSAVSSHCSSCFSPLPPQPFPSSHIPHHVPDDIRTLLYCSSRCSSLDSSLHFSSAEGHLLSLLHETPLTTWHDSSDLRLSLRLLYVFQKLKLIPQIERSERGVRGLEPNDERLMFEENKEGPYENIDNKRRQDENVENCNYQVGVLERIAGLMTNRERLILQENGNGDYPDEIVGKCNDPDGSVENCSENDDFLERIREGAKVMAEARRMHDRDDVNVVAQEEYVVEEIVLCLVLTNAVEVHNRSGCKIGVAVYGATFSWINHSCSPNACYRFLVRPEPSNELRLRICPSAMENGNDLIPEGGIQKFYQEGRHTVRE